MNEFEFQTEQFVDIKILRYQVPGFENLSLSQKLLIYYLSEAGKCGRDILFDQNNFLNINIRKTLELIYSSYKGDKTCNEFLEFEIYLKRIWFSNGIHHHYSMDKFEAKFSSEYFDELINSMDNVDLQNILGNDYVDQLSKIKKCIFDQNLYKKRVVLDSDLDIIKESSNNYYVDCTQAQVEEFYEKIEVNPDKPISRGLNSRLVNKSGKLEEQVYKLGGLYSKPIEQIVHNLEKAKLYAENPEQLAVIESLVEFYRTGDLELFDAYSINWVKDLDSHVDFVNGFIEVYGDAMGLKASWESVVNIKNIEASQRTEIISNNAQWFEDNSPIPSQYKKKEVKGVSAKVITVASLGGDCHPATPIGINLPNAEWIRKDYGSKSVTIDNITYAYHMSSLNSGVLEEFSYDQTEIKRAKEHANLAGNLHTDLHECLGHGSGQMKENISTDSLKSYYSTIEEARADLFALYYIMDEKLVELGLIPSLETGKSEYDSYIRNGLMVQLSRVELGKDLEESHMRNRQLIALWVLRNCKNNEIEKIVRDGKTYFKINDYEALRILFGDLLAEIQRIKSEGDYQKAKELVETYGVKIDLELHEEVKSRYEKLNMAAYAGFINPIYKLKYDADSKIQDVDIEYPKDFAQQMLYYSNNYSYL
ncbi:MAG: dipeptidyl peptidase 3 [Marinifilaceae bacterium]|jgi:dipeptidyl-peptidase-3|nr:dipeptidyl peptidase 3 [Marinifilaceae bacterium]